MTPPPITKWHSSKLIYKSWQVGNFKADFTINDGDGFMGRLGGGWSWKLGAMGAKNELVLELIFCRIGILYKKKLPAQMK